MISYRNLYLLQLSLYIMFCAQPSPTIVLHEFKNAKIHCMWVPLWRSQVLLPVCLAVQCTGGQPVQNYDSCWSGGSAEGWQLKLEPESALFVNNCGPPL